jgi:hypothetical protein
MLLVLLLACAPARGAGSAPIDDPIDTPLEPVPQMAGIAGDESARAAAADVTAWKRSLEQAMARLEKLRAPSSPALRRAEGARLRDALTGAERHHERVRQAASPPLRADRDFRYAEQALSDAARLHDEWKRRAQESGYWDDPARVKADLDRLEERVRAARDGVRSVDARFG